MLRTNLVWLLSAMTLAIGCGTDTPPAGPTGPGDAMASDASAADAGVPDAAIDAPGTDAAIERTALRTCLDEGGALVEQRAIDNQVLVAHGAVVAMAVSSRGQISVASTDGSLKFWSPFGPGASYDTAFDEGTAIVRALVYGDDDYLVAGDDEGLVSLENATGGPARDAASMGDSAIVAVAVDADGSRVAAAGAQLRVWSPGDGAVVGPIETAVTTVTSLVFVDGKLLVAGSSDGQAVLEVRSAAAPTELRAVFSDATLGAITDVAVSADASRLVAVGDGFLLVLPLADVASPRLRVDDTGHSAIGVALDWQEQELVTIGADDTLRVFSATDGAELARLDSPDLVAIEREPTTGQLVVAGGDAFIRLYECAP